jgi:hypothetical protein
MPYTTGTKTVLTLRKYIDGQPTNETKANSSSDPDYIPPYVDTVDCPISEITTTTTTAAPTTTTTTAATTSTSTTTTLRSVWYQMTDCSDSSTKYSQQYNEGDFAINERVTSVGGLTAVITGEGLADPGGLLYAITSTGLTGCP